MKLKKKYFKNLIPLHMSDSYPIDFYVDLHIIMIKYNKLYFIK